MGERIGNYFVITVNNFHALEEISFWICRVLEKPYYIELEKFPHVTIYRLYINVADYPDDVSEMLKRFLQVSNVKLMKKGED